MKLQANFFLLFLLVLVPLLSIAEIKAPNYNFKMQDLNLLPLTFTVEEVKNKYPDAKLLKKSESISLYQFKYKADDFVLNIWFQVSNLSILDFYILFPTYFLHDRVHENLIELLGQQDQFEHINGTSLYIWNNSKNRKIVYAATCTITCFPIYLSVIKITEEKVQDYKPILETFDQLFTN